MKRTKPEAAAPPASPGAVMTDVRVTPLDGAGVPNGPTVHYAPEGLGDVFHLAPITELPDDAERGDVLARLAVLAGNIGLLTDLLDGAYAVRIALWKVGRAMVPPITQRELGQASGVSDVAIAKKLRESA